jgi:hypothetical protein
VPAHSSNRAATDKVPLSLPSAYCANHEQRTERACRTFPTQHGERLRPGPPGGIISDLGSESTQTECGLLTRVPSDDNPVDQVPGAQQARHVLPRDLPKAIMHLTDEELARLLAATIAETERRGGVTPLRGKQEPSFSLTRGQMNAVRAAFKAGITPARIARQFGLSRSDVRKALSTVP